MSSEPSSHAFRGVKSLTFDLMGTCVDWHTSISSSLHEVLPPTIDASELAMDWRAGFFTSILHSFEQKRTVPDIDIVHQTVLEALLVRRGILIKPEDQRFLVEAWHKQIGWPDAVEGLAKLKTAYDIVVLANGSTRLQLDIVNSAGLPFHALFSSQLLGLSKPDPEIYKRCIELLDRRPEEVAMVAAHIYDLRAAKQTGMRTVYIQRTTEDPKEDMEAIRSEVDLFIDGRDEMGGLLALANTLL